MKKLISVICAITMIFGIFSVTAYASDTGTDYTITNPYENVDWSWKQYKADLHTHTNASDGDNTLKEMLEVNYDYGFDIYAVSDHGTTNYSWTDQQVVPSIKVILSVKDGLSKIEALDENGGTATNGNRYDMLIDGENEYYYQTLADGTEGQKMLRVPYANEQNPTSLNNAHVNTWFVDYGHGRLGGTSEYETPIKAVHELGGLSVINHPGEYTNARDEDCTDDAYNYADADYRYYINKFTSILSKYDSCMGIDMNSKGDGRTRFDRKLWDILLMNLAPAGRNVLGIATSDAHRISAAYTGYTLMLMSENTVDNLYNCMKNGEFLAASRCIGNHDELKEIADYLIASKDAEAVAIGNDILSRQAQDYEAKYEADYVTPCPTVTDIAVDNDTDTISIKVEDDLCIRWIADGETIAYGDSIDLDDYSDNIGSYVRAEIFGKGGIVYTQAFLLDYESAPEENIKEYFIDLWCLASALPDTVVRLLGKCEIFDVIWKIVENM